ncbi:aminotransferase [candidate division CSSED10-310 bacterium]|uniref:Aminotransferase n=1 Tax=candidate division CSSED10-310 bacterium TaxID=2855610 RepID=A0ABV6YYE8_UNCC1
MRAQWSPHLKQVANPPIVQFKQEIARLLPPHREILDLTQAIPSYLPPAIVRQYLLDELKGKKIFFYTEDQGLLELRKTICEQSEQKNIQIAPDNILVTAGANMAFFIALASILQPGEEVIVPTPYYFNHEMAIRLCHGVPVEVHLRPETGFSLDPELIEKGLSPRTRAIVVVSPNNPTGALYSAQNLHQVYELCRRHGLFLIHDETYEVFDLPDRQHYTLLSRDDWSENLISIHSYSKTFSLTGFRVGYLVCNRELLSELLKIQDTLVICAPHFGQKAALLALHNDPTWLAEKKQLMEKKRQLFHQVCADVNRNFTLLVSGAFFGYVKHLYQTSARAVAMSLAQKAAVTVLPGEFFGTGQESYLRFALGNIEEKQFEELGHRLKKFTMSESSS